METAGKSLITGIQVVTSRESGRWASAAEPGFRPPYTGTVVDATRGKQPDGFRHEPDGDTLKTPEKTLPNICPRCFTTVAPTPFVFLEPKFSTRPCWDG